VQKCIRERYDREEGKRNIYTDSKERKETGHWPESRGGLQNPSCNLVPRKEGFEKIISKIRGQPIQKKGTGGGENMKN